MQIGIYEIVAFVLENHVYCNYDFENLFFSDTFHLKTEIMVRVYVCHFLLLIISNIPKYFTLEFEY